MHRWQDKLYKEQAKEQKALATNRNRSEHARPNTPPSRSPNPISPESSPYPSSVEAGRGEYDVALSFAGEDRAYVEAVARHLLEANVSVFYDAYEQVGLWGKNLVDHLADVYGKRSRFVVIFASKHYANKAWPTLERQAAQARAFQEHQEVVLPVRFDDTEVPGILPTVGYIDLRNTTEQELAEKIMQKVDRVRRAPQDETLAEKAARIRRETETAELSANDRLAFLAMNGTLRAGDEVIALFDAMASHMGEVGGHSERDNQRWQACFHLNDVTVGIAWSPPYHFNRVDEGRLAVTLWGGHWSLLPQVMTTKRPPEVWTAQYVFDITPYTHKPLWTAEQSTKALSTLALAEHTVGQLLDHIEHVRQRD